MKKSLKGGIFITLILMIFLTGIVIANHGVYIIRWSGTPTFDDSLNFNEDVSNFYNITINNTDLSANITQVNISFPSSFTFTKDTNITKSPRLFYAGANHTFTNTSTTLSWENNTGDGDSKYVFYIGQPTFGPLGHLGGEVGFNLTASEPGVYNLTVATSNRTATILTNITITINDTSAPLLSFGSGTADNCANVSQDYIFINVSVVESSEANITFEIFNSSGVINSTTFTDSTRNLNVSNLVEGNYSYNVSVYDNSGYFNVTETRTITLDTTSPNFTFSCSSTSVNVGDTITCSCNVTDNTDPTINASFTVNPSTSSAGSFITSCTSTDNAGNGGSSNITYTVSSPNNNKGGGGGGGGGGDPSLGQTYAYSPEQISNGITRTIKEDDQIKFKLSEDGKSEDHYVKSKKIYSDKVEITIESDPINVTFYIGDSKTFDIDNDGEFYDLYIRLNNIVNSSADLTIRTINETIPESKNNLTQLENNLTEENNSFEQGNPMNIKISTELWVVIVILILIGLGIIVIFLIKKKRKNIFRKLRKMFRNN